MTKLNRSLAQLIFEEAVKAGLVSANAAAAMGTGDLRLVPGQVIHRVNMGTNEHSTRIKLLNDNNSRLDGISDFKGLVLPDNLNCVFDHIRVGIALGADGITGKAPYKNLAGKIDRALLNSIFDVKQKGQTKVRQLIQALCTPSEEVENEGAASDTSTAYGFVQPKAELFTELPDPQVLGGGITTSMEILLPEGVAFDPGAEFLYVETVFSGFITIEA